MQLISYIAPGAPATRREAEGKEPSLRLELGFTPRWYRQYLDIDFGRRYHTDPAYRRLAIIAMRDLLAKRFPGSQIGRHDLKVPLDLLTGTYGACIVAGIYGVPIIYSSDGWPNCEPAYLAEGQLERLEPPDLASNPVFQNLLTQVDWIARQEGRVEGFINWQGVLNNAQRLCGERLFLDLFDNPGRCKRLFDCVTSTMIDAAKQLHTHQRITGFNPGFFTVSNCLVNMVSPGQYERFLLPHDRRIAEAFGCIGIHNCAWNATPLFDAYAQVPYVGYIDMGIESDFTLARKRFPTVRRALMYTPMDLVNKTLMEIEVDFKRAAEELSPCDIVLADIDAGTADTRVIEALEMGKHLGQGRAVSR